MKIKIPKLLIYNRKGIVDAEKEDFASPHIFNRHLGRK
jgi:hypothetical protein